MCYLCLFTARGTTYVEQLALAATPDHPVYMTVKYKILDEEGEARGEKKGGGKDGCLGTILV